MRSKSKSEERSEKGEDCLGTQEELWDTEMMKYNFKIFRLG